MEELFVSPNPSGVLFHLDCYLKVLIPMPDDAETSHGTPVGLQLIGRRFEEEKVLGLATMIAKSL